MEKTEQNTEEEKGKCPQCGEKLEELIAYSLEENKQTITLDSRGHLDWSASEPIELTCQRIEIECPNCNAIIYKNNGNSEDPRFKQLLGGV